jgi:hypothetical protein
VLSPTTRCSEFVALVEFDAGIVVIGTGAKSGNVWWSAFGELVVPPIVLDARLDGSESAIRDRRHRSENTASDGFLAPAKACECGRNLSAVLLRRGGIVMGYYCGKVNTTSTPGVSGLVTIKLSLRGNVYNNKYQGYFTQVLTMKLFEGVSGSSVAASKQHVVNFFR